MSTMLTDVPNCNIYLDDVVIYCFTRSEHVANLKVVFNCLAAASLTLNLAIYEFGKASVIYLGKEVGKGQAHPIDVKVTASLL